MLALAHDIEMQLLLALSFCSLLRYAYVRLVCKGGRTGAAAHSLPPVRQALSSAAARSGSRRWRPRAARGAPGDSCSGAAARGRARSRRRRACSRPTGAYQLQ